MKDMLVLAGVMVCASLMCSCHSAPDQNEIGRYVLTPAGVTTKRLHTWPLAQALPRQMLPVLGASIDLPPRHPARPPPSRPGHHSTSAC